ncbi:MAG: response regulator [Desulfobacterales bacterium]|nr:MAG: response regulator [Desulfobacterales bacterium]
MPKNALVVDSDFFFVEFLSELLEKRGYAVRKAHNGKEAISKIEEEERPLDIIFVDLFLPKVDGRQLIHFIRTKYHDTHRPIVTISGTIIEQMGELDEIGADYYIAKGPIAKLTIQLNEFLTEIETQPFCPPADKKVLASGNVFPRRDAMELINGLRFYRAVIESIGVGIIIVDSDTRILAANPTALEIVAKSAVDVMNRPVTEIFPLKDKAELRGALERIIRQPDLGKITFLTTFQSQKVRTIVSAFPADNPEAGWIVALGAFDPQTEKD